MRLHARLLAVLVCAGLAAFSAAAQTGHDTGLPDPIPPPLPKQPPPKDASEYAPIAPESDAPWGLPAELLEPLYGRAAAYAEYSRRFTCDESVRQADYDENGDVTKERSNRYGYLLIRNEVGLGVREYRQEFTKDGSLKSGEIEDREPFPAAYAWVFLFSRFNEPYFSFRYLGERFDGFDWVHEIQFKGSLNFTNGKDIREWEGTVLIDAVTSTALEIRAEPAGQRERIDALYRRYQGSFNILGRRTGPKPLGYRAFVQFRHRDRESSLTFPTELRYDTFRAIGRNRIVPVSASTRDYAQYRIFKPEAREGVVVQDP